MQAADIHFANVSSHLPLPFFETTVPAGFPSPADHYMDKALDLNELLITHPAATYFVRVAGDSMEGAGIFSGDLLIVDRALEAANGKIIIAVVDGGFTVKRLLIQNGHFYLSAENPRYPTIKLSEESGFQVWGVVTYVIHKPR